jgi:cell division protein FtsQ
MSAPALSRDAMRDLEGDGARDARDERARRPRWKAWVGLSILLLVAAAIASMPWWVPPALSRLAFFRVRRVEIDGARYATAPDIVARMHVDTTWSVWSDLRALARRVETHPLVASARVERRLPGTLRVVVTEREPVAIAPTRDGVAVLAADGRALPIDPSRVGGVDAPLVSAPDGAMLRLLAALHAATPALYARVSELRRVGADELRFAVAPGVGSTGGQPPFIIRAGADVTPARLTDVLPVESDLARRRVRVVELDLRFRDQVIARLP